MRINAPAAPLGKQGAPYALEIVDWGERKRQVARYTCGCCKRTIDVPIKPDNKSSLSIEMHRRILRNKGWIMTSRADHVRCDNCQGSHKPMPVQPDPKPNGHAVSNAPANAPPQPSTLPSSIQRLNIRTKLDTCFDDADGVYLSGESDETIAAALNIPRAWVTNIREAAYGPIRQNPEIAECMKLLNACAARQADLARDIDRLRERLTKLGG